MTQISGKVELGPNDRYHIIPGHLTIHKIIPKDQGEYTCEAFNILGKISRRVSLQLSGSSFVILTHRRCAFVIETCFVLAPLIQISRPSNYKSNRVTQRD